MSVEEATDDALIDEMRRTMDAAPQPSDLGRWRTASAATPAQRFRARFGLSLAPFVGTATVLAAVATFSLVGLHGGWGGHSKVGHVVSPPLATMPPSGVPSLGVVSPSHGAPTGTPASAASSSMTTPAVDKGQVNAGPTAAPTPSVDCISKPSACGFPDATDTGVPVGASLSPVNPVSPPSGTTWSGNTLTVVADNTVLQGIELTNAVIVVRANNVTIKDVSVASGGR